MHLIAVEATAGIFDNSVSFWEERIQGFSLFQALTELIGFCA
jgi:hypothetical protein